MCVCVCVGGGGGGGGAHEGDRTGGLHKEGAEGHMRGTGRRGGHTPVHEITGTYCGALVKLPPLPSPQCLWQGSHEEGRGPTHHITGTYCGVL